MPPWTHTIYTPISIQQRENAVREIVQLATALDLCRSSSGLAGATPRQIAQLNRALTALSCPDLNEPGSHTIIELYVSLFASPEPRAALVQLFTSALCALAPPEALADANSCSSRQQQMSRSSSSPAARDVDTSRGPGPATSAADLTAPAIAPTGPRQYQYTSILIGCTHILQANIYHELVRKDAGDTSRRTREWVATCEALPCAGAMAAAARLFVTDNRRPAGAKLLSPAQYLELSQLLCLLFYCALHDEGLGAQVLPAVAGSYLIEHWVPAVMGRVRAESLPSAGGRRGKGDNGDPAVAQSGATRDAASALESFNRAVENLVVFMWGAPPSNGSSSSHCTWRAPPPGLPGAAPQLLSGRRLQYFAAVQAVSQLYAADGGPLYGLPYDALLPYVMTDRQPGERRGQEALSCDGLCWSVRLWYTCWLQCPPESLLPLRPRHLLAMCLRTARVALVSLEVGRSEAQQAAEEQGQQQQQWERAKVEPGCMPERIPGAASAGQLDGVRWALLEPLELRRRLEAQGCPGLAAAAMELASSLLTAQTRSRGRAGEENVAGGNGGSRQVGVVSAGCSGSGGGGGDSSDGGGGGGSGSTTCGGSGSGEGQGGGKGGGGADGVGGVRSGIAGVEGPSFWRPRTRCPPLLRDPSLAAGWWRLALGAARAAFQQESSQQQQQAKCKRQQQEEEKEGGICDSAVGCAHLLLPFRLHASEKHGGCLLAAGARCAYYLPGLAWTCMRVPCRAC